MPLNLMLREEGRKPNDWEPTFGEMHEAFQSAKSASDGIAFVDALYASRFDQGPVLEDEQRIAGCRAFAEACFGTNEDAWTRTQFACVQTENSAAAVASAFRDLFRGYSDAEYAAAVAIASKTRASVISEIDQTMSENTAAMGRAGIHSNDLLKHRENLDTLSNLKTAVQRQSDGSVARSQLDDTSARRLMPRMSQTLWFAPLTNERLIIDGCDAARVSFPFRFLVFAPLSSYHGLLKEWRATGDAVAVTKKIAADVFVEDYVDKLLALFRQSPLAAVPDAANIERVLEELRQPLAQRRLQTITLICVTQTEGMIWRYAELLNATGTPIYYDKPRTPPMQGYDKIGYRWDRKAAKPVLDNAGNRADSRPLTSAYALLSNTQLEQAFRPNAIDFALADYTNDRNGLAHGSLFADERLAVQAALLLGTVMQCISFFERAGRPIQNL
ncbi:MAG: hypothetical protein ACREJD_02965 [Phycisphaerales bacterium]